MERMSTDGFKTAIERIYGDKMSVVGEYVNARTKINMCCSEHGRFLKTPYELINLRRGCQLCSERANYKPRGYWNDKERCLEEARKYNGRYAFQLKSSAAYQSCLRNGWLDDVVFNGEGIQYMREDDKINIVYVYEFEKEKTCYVGRTNNITRRHRQHVNGERHKNGTVTYDSVHDFSTEIPQPKILEENLTARESQIKEHEWLEKYRLEGWTVLNKAKTGDGVGSLGARLKWHHDACKDEARKYSKKSDFKKGCQPAYQSSVRNGWIDEFFPHNTNKEKGFWVLEEIQKVASKYSSMRDFRKDYPFPYRVVIKNGWKDKIVFKDDKG